MKLSWGTGIAGVYLLFVLAVLAVVLFSASQEVNLVTEDYYEKELKYQSRIDNMERTRLLTEQLKISLENEIIIFNFPAEISPDGITGGIYFYRPSDDKKDFRIPIELNSKGEQVISASEFQKGLWRIQVEWVSGSDNYFNEHVLMID